MNNDNPNNPPRVASGAGQIQAAAKIQVTRTTGIVDRMRAYRIVVDGQEMARLKAGKSVDLSVNPGMHTVVAKIDWCSSPTLNANIREGDTVQFACGSNLSGLRLFLVLSMSYSDQINILH